MEKTLDLSAPKSRDSLRLLRSFVSRITCHGLTWLKSKGFSVTGPSLSKVTSPLKFKNWTPFDSVRPFHFAPSSGCSGISSPVIVIVKIHFLFDMVAEQAGSWPAHLLRPSVRPVKSRRRRDDDEQTHLIIRKRKKSLELKFQEESDIKMFTNDPKFNRRLPSPTSFDGVKPSYVEWSEELLTYLSVTDYQKFVPILQAVTGHKVVITKKGFHWGCFIRTRESGQKKETEKEGHLSGVNGPVDQNQADAVQVEINALNVKKASKLSTLMKADNFSGMSCFTKHQATPIYHGSSHHENV